MRGKVSFGVAGQIQHGITPAYAGKRNRHPVKAPGSQDHPRVCGEKRAKYRKQRQVSGSPPRMRGKARRSKRCRSITGITPAYAGKRPSCMPTYTNTRDHPRVCGEKEHQNRLHGPTIGSPPRMRGKEIRVSFSSRWLRITPAYAGKRPARWARLALWKDHPRVCGEKDLSTIMY